MFQTRKEAVRAIGEYIEGFYNPVRKHFAFEYRAPIQFEAMNRNLEQETLH